MGCSLRQFYRSNCCWVALCRVALWCVSQCRASLHSVPLHSVALHIVISCQLFIAIPSAANAQADTGFKFLTVKVLDPEGEPLPEIDVDIRIDGAEFPMPTDDEGVVAFNVPTSDKTRMRLKVSRPGYVAVAANWIAGEELPDSFTIRMQKGTTIGGIIRNEDGEPIEGVKVSGHISSQNDMRGGGKLEPILSGVIGTTDRAGRWKNESAPAKQVAILTDFEHPDYVHENIYGYRAGNWEELHTLEHIVVLQKGIVLRGQVLDPDGIPATGVKVTLSKGRYYSDQVETFTDEQGNYRLNNVKPSSTNITVLSSDWAPAMKQVIASVEMEPVDFRLKPGQLVSFQITDQDGQPVEGVKVVPDEWRELEILPQSPLLSNSKGLWEWEFAPADTIQYRLYKQGYMSSSVVDVTPRDEPYEVTLPPELVFTGNVTAAETGQPVEKFRVVEGIFWNKTDDEVVWQEHDKASGTNGKYRVAYNSGYAGFKIKVEAEGYRPQASRLVAVDEGQVEIDFALETGSGPSGTVQLADGSPAVGAEVLMADDPQSRITVHNGEYERQSRTIVVITDATGKYTLPIPEGKFSLVCLHEGGWACLLEAEPTRTSADFTLESWAQVEGKMLSGETPIAGGQASLWFPDLEQEMRSSLVQWTNRAMSDDQGVFSMPRVRVGNATIQRNIRFGPEAGRSLGSFSSHFQPCKLVAGETLRVQIGGTGRAVSGRLVAPDDYSEQIPWAMGRVHLNYWTEKNVATKQPTQQQIAEADKAKYQRYATQIRKDGQFEINDVLPGKYQLDAVVYQPRADRDYNWDELGRLKTVIEIPSEDDTQPFELGKHILPIVAKSLATEPTN